MTTPIGTTIPRRGIGTEHAGSALRCTAYAEYNPRNPINMNIGCQHFTLTNLLANGGTIGEYEPDNARVKVTFSGMLRTTDHYMQVPFHPTPQSIGNLNEYVREAVVIDPSELTVQQRHVQVRERIYSCGTAGHTDHFFMVARPRDGHIAQIAKINLRTNYVEHRGPDAFVVNPDCRPESVDALTNIFPGGTFTRDILGADVADGQLVGNQPFTG